MTAPVLGAVMGRPATTLAGLTRSLERARLVNISLREQLHIERLEGVALAEVVRQESAQLRRAVVLERWDIVEQAANAVGYRAARHLSQRSSTRPEGIG